MVPLILAEHTQPINTGQESLVNADNVLLQTSDAANADENKALETASIDKPSGENPSSIEKPLSENDLSNTVSETANQDGSEGTVSTVDEEGTRTEYETSPDSSIPDGRIFYGSSEPYGYIPTWSPKNPWETTPITLPPP